MKILSIVLFLMIVKSSLQQTQLKCLVCKQVVNEIISAVANEDPKKTIQVGSYRIQPDGTQKQSQIKYAGSEMHLNEVLETVCNSMEDFAQAKDKETGELTLINLGKDVDKLSSHELIQDPDLNRSLIHYCESFLEEYEDDIIKIFKSTEIGFESEFKTKLCSHSAGYCSQYHAEL